MFGIPPFLGLLPESLDESPFPVSVLLTEIVLVARVMNEWLGDKWQYLGVVRGVANIGVQGIEVFLETQHRLSDQVDQWLVQGYDEEARRQRHCPRPNLIVLRDEVQADLAATDSEDEFLRTVYLDVGTEDDPIESWDIPTQEYDGDGGLGLLHQA